MRACSRALGSIGVSPGAVRIVPAHRAKVKNAEHRSRLRRHRAQQAATASRAAGCDGIARSRLR
jgi:hypothetical protein